MNHVAFRTYLIVFIFLAIISFPLINSNIHLLKDVESFENRGMAKKPVFNINHLDPFPVKYDTFYTDNFDLRNRLIRYFNIFNIEAFRKSPVTSVIIGADNWLYLSGDEMDSYMGKNRMTRSDLDVYRSELEYRKNYLAQKGIKFYFLVLPCKASIHTENIGYEYYRIHKDTWGEQLNNFLNKYSSVKPIDVFDSLKKFKKYGNLYYKLDNHWNDLGAFYTANQVFLRLKKDFPSIEPLRIEDYNIVYSKKQTGDLGSMLGNLGIFSEFSPELYPKKGFKATEGKKKGYDPGPSFPYPWEYEMVKEIKGSKKPKILIISDSFGKKIFPFLAENFSKTVKIFDAWRYDLNEKIVEQEKPDIVIVMINEPVIKSVLTFSGHRAEK